MKCTPPDNFNFSSKKEPLWNVVIIEPFPYYYILLLEIEKLLKIKQKISKNQFRSRKETREVILTLRMILERKVDKNNTIVASIDLENARGNPRGKLRVLNQHVKSTD